MFGTMFKSAGIAALFTLGMGFPLAAQVVPQGEVAGFKIAKLVENRMCTAAWEGKSRKGHPVLYTYYGTAIGQRWHVAGFATPENLGLDAVTVGLGFDGTEQFARETEVRDGDFMFPFATLEEVETFEAAIPDAETLNVDLAEAGDGIDIPVADFRAALGAIRVCLTSLR